MSAFTLVFEGDIRRFADNPMTAKTPFGVAYAAGVGNAFSESDRLRDALLKIAEMSGVPFEAQEFARGEARRFINLD